MAKKTCRCFCGFVAAADEADLVTAVQAHAREVHHMEYTREEILAMAEPAE